MEGINQINLEVREHCLENGLGHINHRYFGKSEATDRLSIRSDGVHLNFHGVGKLQASLASYLRRWT